MSRDDPPSYELSANEDLEQSERFSQNPSPLPTSMNRFSRPLIGSVRNGWQSHSNPAYHPVSGTGPDHEKYPDSIQMCLSIISAPRFRRYAVVYLSIFLLGWASWSWLLYPRLQESNSLFRALDPATEDESGGWFGSHSMPTFDGLIQLKTLGSEYIPGALESGDRGMGSQKRLVIVGDVHGCKDELLQLLKKVEFSTADGDHLIFTGDIINKGPDSSGVVDLAREHSASCVRGNHEDRILLLRHDMEKAKALDGPRAGDSDIYTTRELNERDLARSFTQDQVKWLDQCPVILDVGKVPDIGQLVVVHGGLVPGVELEKQDPFSVMNMRTIDVDTHVPSAESKGLNWAKLFDKYQSKLFKNRKSEKKDASSSVMTVVYGHDAKTGLKIRTFTKGLDSGCVKGGKLTALIMEDGGKQSLVQVRCREYKK